MILYWLLFLIIAFLAYRDWKRSVIIWMPLQLLFNECVCLKYSSPAVSFVLAVDAMLLGFYFIYKEKSSLNNDYFFFKKVFIIYLASYLLSTVVSIAPFSSTFTNTIKYFIQNFGILFLFHKALRDYEDIKLFLKATTWVVIAIVSLGLFESVLKDNLVLDFVFLNAPLDSIQGKMYYVPPFLSHSGAVQIRYGMVRSYSFFNIHIAFGCACAMLYYFYLFVMKHKVSTYKPIYLYGILILLVMGVFLCNSKTPLLGLFFFSLPFIGKTNVINTKICKIAVLLVLVGLALNPGIFYNLIAIFDEKVADDGGGSTTNLRVRQFEVALNLFERNPILGNGVGSTSVFQKNIGYADLMGSESSWLKILPERGLFGAVAYLYFYLYTFLKLNLWLPKKEVMCFLLGLLLMETATGFMNFAIFGSIMIVMYRFSKLQMFSEVEDKNTNS